MASQLIGRAMCPECGFEKAHIKIKMDKDGAKPYRHCPECGAQYFPRSAEQADRLREKIKTQKIDLPEPPKTAGKVIQTLSEVVEEKEKKFRTVFGVKVEVDD